MQIYPLRVWMLTVSNALQVDFFPAKVETYPKSLYFATFKLQKNMSHRKRQALLWSTLFLLLCFFPCLFICVSLWIKAQFTKTPLSKKSDIKTVLITGAPLTKALHIARTMGQSGHQVIVAEQDWKHLFSLSRFSRYVKKFVLLPNNISYEDGLVQLWENEGIDCFLPILERERVPKLMKT